MRCEICSETAYCGDSEIMVDVVVEGEVTREVTFQDVKRPLPGFEYFRRLGLRA